MNPQKSKQRIKQNPTTIKSNKSTNEKLKANIVEINSALGLSHNKNFNLCGKLKSHEPIKSKIEGLFVCICIQFLCIQMQTSRKSKTEILPPEFHLKAGKLEHHHLALPLWEQKSMSRDHHKPSSNADKTISRGEIEASKPSHGNGKKTKSALIKGWWHGFWKPIHYSLCFVQRVIGMNGRRRYRQVPLILVDWGLTKLKISNPY